MSEAVRVEFDEAHGIVVALEVEGPDALLSASDLNRALLSLRVQVVWTDSLAAAGRVRHRLGVCEFDGAQIAAKRRSDIVSALANVLLEPEAASVVRSTRPSRPSRAA